MSDTITVCAACLQACCWQGEFMCLEANSAGTTEKTIEELTALKREHPTYWDIDPAEGLSHRVVRARRRRLGGLADKSQYDDASTEAFDAIAAACGCPEWQYPGQIVRDAVAVVAERDRLATENAELQARAADLEASLEAATATLDDEEAAHQESLALLALRTSERDKALAIIAAVKAKLPGLWASVDQPLEQIIANMLDDRDRWTKTGIEMTHALNLANARVAELDRAMTDAIQVNRDLTERMVKLEAAEKQRRDTAAQCWPLGSDGVSE